MKASLLYRSNCVLGEGASWHSKRKSFFWVDIECRMIYEYHWANQKINQWRLSHRVSLILESAEDKMLVALQGGIAFLDLATGRLDWILDLEKNIETNRTNDGACDSEGRLWIGTMDLTCRPGSGNLYLVKNDLQVSHKLSGLSIPNGIAWSQNNDRMYHVDTGDHCIRSYLFEADTGEIKFEKVAIEVTAEMGSPDGMCMDEQGRLWVAHWGGFGVYRWDPVSGKLLDKIDLPVPQVTSCAFGGDNMEKLLITTAKENLSASDLEKWPESGNVFVADPGVKGLESNKLLLKKSLLV